VVGATALVALVVVAGLAFAGTTRLRRERWVHRTALPELRRLVDAAESDSALELALRIEQAAPRDSTLRALFPTFAQRTVIGSVPPGVAVARASFTDTSRWRALGVTPTDSVWLPNEPGLFRFQQAGRRTLYRVGVARFDSVRLTSDSGLEARMVHVLGGRRGVFLVGTDLAPRITLASFLIDRFETSNREYKRFVQAGGYRDRKYWEHPFVDEGRTLSFEAAMARFVDRTGRPSPSTWVGGDYPAGKGEHPVSGVSWYEAAAYASFAGKSLPTVYHWAAAATIQLSRVVVPESNLEGEGPLPVGRDRAVSAFGASDMAGNVREWSFNAAGRGERYILGGGWSDPRYAFPDAQAAKPMDRSAVNGIRLARYASSDANLELASRPIVRAFTDYSRETPVSDAVFASFLPQFDYDPRPLDVRVEKRDSTAEDYITERVSYTTAYGERMAAWVYVPRRGTPPYQSVIIFPGSNALSAGPSTGALDPRLAFLQKTGRLVVLPILKSTFERSDSLASDLPTPSIFWRDHVVMWVKDVRRTLDYLSTRPDVDTTRFAYFGYSWGGNMGGIVPAVEPRFKASVLYVAGFTMERSRPEVDPLHYLPRIKTPVVMLNGKYDFFYPTETAQRPFFELIGTAPAHKRYVVYEGGHDVPREQLVGESLAWLDRYLGRVR
jgi:dienelactone hydrolase